MDPYNTSNRKPVIESVDFVSPDPALVQHIRKTIMNKKVIDFQAARKRLEAQMSDVIEIEIDAAKIPVLPVQRPTLLEQIRATDVDVAELVHVTLEESK